MIEITSEQITKADKFHQKPYVISADVFGLLSKHAPAQKLQIPDQEFLAEMRGEMKEKFQHYFAGPVELVPEEDLREGMRKLLPKAHYPILALDKTFTDCTNPSQQVTHFEMTRMVRWKTSERGDVIFEDIGGLRSRPMAPSIEQQLTKLRTPYRSPITLVDDVIYSASGIKELAPLLAAVNRPIEQVVAAIVIGDAATTLHNIGIDEVISHRLYPTVVDEVCERDFYAGVPYSGRIVEYGKGRYKSAPYFLPFGNPTKWASIEPEFRFDYSVFCLTQSIKLWKEMERLSGNEIRTASDFHPRTGTAFWPVEGLKGQSISKALEKTRENLIRGEEDRQRRYGNCQTI